MKNKKIIVFGGSGMVGSSVVRLLKDRGHDNVLTPTSYDVNLEHEDLVISYMTGEGRDADEIYLCAAKVGGILANDRQSADFITKNIQIQTNVIKWAQVTGCKKLLFLGSSCIYPKMCPQPIKEEYLMTGPLEPTNEAYAVAKISGITMCDMYRKQYGKNFISAMPTNLYGPGDNYDLKNSHVLPALIRKFYEAKRDNEQVVEMWGTGTPRREFLYVDDLAEALLFLMDKYEEAGHINVGTGEDVTIMELAEIIAEVVGFEGEIHRQLDKPDGTPRKLLDVSKINELGWKAKTSLRDGIEKTYADFRRMYT